MKTILRHIAVYVNAQKKVFLSFFDRIFIGAYQSMRFAKNADRSLPFGSASFIKIRSIPIGMIRKKNSAFCAAVQPFRCIYFADAVSVGAVSSGLTTRTFASSLFW